MVRALALAACVVVAAAPTRGAHAEDVDLPPGIVARVLDTDLTYDQFCTTLVQHVLPDLLTSRHGPRAVLDEMAEELMVLTRCRDLGIDVGQDELLKKENELDREIRTWGAGAGSGSAGRSEVGS